MNLESLTVEQLNREIEALTTAIESSKEKIRKEEITIRTLRSKIESLTALKLPLLTEHRAGDVVDLLLKNGTRKSAIITEVSVNVLDQPTYRFNWLHNNHRVDSDQIQKILHKTK